MGLFMNRAIHQKVFKNNEEIKEPNQSYFRRDHLESLLKEQQKSYHSLHQSILAMKALNEQQEVDQLERFDRLSKHLHNIDRKNDQELVLMQLDRLERENKNLQTMVQHGRLFEQKLKDQIQSFEETNQKVLKQLEDHNEAYDQINKKSEEQDNIQNKILTQLSQQNDHQQHLTDRLSNHEAIIEKIGRQVEFIRASLFERTTYLAEKIESGYLITSSYLTKLVTGSHQSHSKNIRMLDKQKSNK